MEMLAAFIAAIALLAVLVLLLPTASDLASVMKWVLSRTVMQPARERASTEPGEREPSRLLFLIPAHNEGRGVAATVQSVLLQRYQQQRIRAVVIADNCDDDTAAAAVAAGADILERHDATRRGKPYAIAWALERLPIASFDGIVILDADAVIDRGYAAALDAAGPLRDKVIECYDGVRNTADSAITRMAGVMAAGRFRGSFQLKGAADLNVPLSDGMCIGSDVLQQHPWSAFGLCEDWELYAQLTAAGVRTELVPAARLYALETRTLRQSESQRSRWLIGKLGVLRREGPALLRSRQANWHQKLDAIAELSAPGPALHLGIAAALAVLMALANAPGMSLLAAGLALSLARPAVYAGVGLLVDPEPGRALAAFTYLPVYSCWRLAVAAASVWPARHRPWVRTARE